jgi:hypothetical protein
VLLHSPPAGVLGVLVFGRRCPGIWIRLPMLSSKAVSYSLLLHSPID